MSSLNSTDDLSIECPNCGVDNRIPLKIQQKKVRCGECKKELPPIPQSNIKPVAKVAVALEKPKPSAALATRKQAKARKVAAKKQLKTPPKPSKPVASKAQKNRIAAKV